jgi:uracil-DNA glycosylase
MVDDAPKVFPEGRKSLEELRAEWVACDKCDLGKRRISVDGQFVFGTGTRRSVMFIGEGPGVEEEKYGQPFVGRSGHLLRTILKALNLKDFYMTNLVTCRSCSPRVDPQGQPILRKNPVTKQNEVAYQDEPPLPKYITECSPRLYEEIYLVDPIVIVGLGATACEALLQRAITITRTHGETRQIAVPGAVHRPQLTPGGKWARTIKKVPIAPTEQNQVFYFFIPTLHPAYILHKGIQDRDARSPFNQLYADISKAVQTYNSYLEVALGQPVAHTMPSDDAVWESYIASTQED